MRNDDLKLLLDQHFSSIEGVIKANGTAIRAKVEAEIGMLNQKVDNIIEHNDKQNGWIEKNNKRIECLETGPANMLARRMQRKWFWVAVVIGVVLVYFVLEGLFYGTSLGEWIIKLI